MFSSTNWNLNSSKVRWRNICVFHVRQTHLRASCFLEAVIIRDSHLFSYLLELGPLTLGHDTILMLEKQVYGCCCCCCHFSCSRYCQRCCGFGAWGLTYELRCHMESVLDRVRRDNRGRADYNFGTTTVIMLLCARLKTQVFTGVQWSNHINDWLIICGEGLMVVKQQLDIIQSWTRYAWRTCLLGNISWMFAFCSASEHSPDIAWCNLFWFAFVPARRSAWKKIVPWV